jgi:hypothetical protein
MLKGYKNDSNKCNSWTMDEDTQLFKMYFYNPSDIDRIIAQNVYWHGQIMNGVQGFVCEFRHVFIV